MQVAAKFWAVGITAFGCAEDDADGLVDVAQALDHLAGGSEGGLPVGGGDAGMGNGLRHEPMVRKFLALSF